MTLNTKQINRYAHDIRGREKENIKLTGEEKIWKRISRDHKPWAESWVLEKLGMRSSVLQAGTMHEWKQTYWK